MMLDIFSSFDPYNSSLYSSSSLLYWLAVMTPIFILFPTLWINQNTSSWLLIKPIEIMYDQIKRTQGGNLGIMPLLLTTLFPVIMVINLTGMIPYLLSASSHLLLTVSLGLPLWLCMIMSGLQNDPKTSIANLLPGGAPSWLNPALIPIETLSIIVRPLTLTVRLAANMSAGHIVLGLIGIYSAASLFTIPTLTLLLLTQTAYMIFEFAICLIQAYIFCLLLSLYSDEHPPKLLAHNQ